MSAKPSKWLLALIVGLYLLLTVGYGVLNPLFEAPDEHHHFFTVTFIAENGRLPIADLQNEWQRQEAAQPPLYYLLGALLAAPFETSQAQTEIWLNPHARLGDASALTNINWAVHTANEAFPWQGSALAAHLLRGMSTVLGLGTLLCIYGSGRLLWPGRPERALLATALVAFLPQFNFLHSAISNDPLIIFLASAALWQLLYIWLSGGGNGRFRSAQHGRSLLLGITVGLAILSKNAGILLLLYAFLVLILAWLKETPPAARHSFDRLRSRSLIINLSLLLLPALLMGGWLWLRNWQLYQDITAANMFVAFAGGDRQATLLQVLGEWRAIWPSLFALFGWFNLRPPPAVYWIWDAIVLTALAGFVYGLLKNKNQRVTIESTEKNSDKPVLIEAEIEAKTQRYPREKSAKSAEKQSFFDTVDLQSLLSILQQPWFTAVLLGVWVVIVYAGLALFMFKTEAAQGRLLLPAILPLALGVAYGLSRFDSRAVMVAAPLLALATSLLSLFFVIQPAYARPPVLEALPPTAAPLLADMGQGLQLVGAEIDTETAVPGDDIWLTLYWQASDPPTDPPEFTLEILGRDLTGIGQAQGYHGRGLYPANLWSPNQIIADRFALRLADEIEAPVWAEAYVGLVGETSRALAGRLEVEPESWPTNPAPALANMGDGIELTAVTFAPTSAAPGDTITVSVQWRVTAAPGHDYTTLLHLGQPGQPPLATGDNQPINGRYPTHLWQAGELIDDSYTIVMPEGVGNGRYPLWLGLYDAQTFTRLPLSVNGVRQPDDVYQVGWVERVDSGQ